MNRFEKFTTEELEEIYWLNVHSDRNRHNHILRKLFEEAMKELDKRRMGSLRDYIHAKSFGAYHHFLFTIGTLQIDICSTEEFDAVFQPKLLDEYYVIKDDKTENGGNCENYQAIHRLSIGRKSSK